MFFATLFAGISNQNLLLYSEKFSKTKKMIKLFQKRLLLRLKDDLAFALIL